MEDARHALSRLIDGTGESLAELSRMLRRNDAYLHQFLYRGSPRRLAEDDRRLLAAHFAVDEAVLGGPAAAPESVPVPYLSIRASAGTGLSAAGEHLIRSEPFAPHLLRDAGVAPANASLIEASGDSMAPAILDGDRLLVDRGDTKIGSGGVFVFRRDDEVLVKRLTATRDSIIAASDNSDFPTISVPRLEIAVIGRVKLLVRRPV